MDLFELFISELRRNPERNPRVSTKEALEQYKDDPNVFISFVADVGTDSHSYGAYHSPDPFQRIARRANPGKNISGHKIGINPQTPYRTTPVGIYTYPLKDVWNDLVANRLPFAQSRPFIYVVRPTGKTMDLGSYSDADLKRDIKRLMPVIERIIEGQDVSPMDLVNYWATKAWAQTPGGRFWAITYQIANLEAQRRHGLSPYGDPAEKSDKGIPWVWNGLLRSLGYDGIIDRTGKSIIHDNEPYQAVFLSTKALDVAEVVYNPEKQFNESVVLNELDWYDRSPLPDVLEKNKGRWIHFSSIPKLGVNPSKRHADPHGIYFYPVDWFLTKPERIRIGQQYGTDWPYYFLSDIDMSGPGLVLSKVTWKDVEALAQRNGWMNWLEDYYRNKDTAWKFPHYVRKDHPGSFLWHFIDALQKSGTIRWNQAFAGLTYIYDDDQSIIHNMEPHQIIVLDPRIIRNTSMGDNKNVGWQRAHDDKGRPDVWRETFKRIMDALKQTYGGKIVWKENTEKRPYDAKKPKAKNRAPSYPELHFHKKDRDVVVRIVDRHGSFGVDVVYQYGREEGQFRAIDGRDFMDGSIEQIVATIGASIDEVMAFESDLRFTPIVGEEQAKQFMETNILSPGAKVEWKTRIKNPSGNFSWHDMTIASQSLLKAGDNHLEVNVDVRVKADSLSGAIYVNGKYGNFFSATQIGEFTDLEEMEETLFDKFCEWFDRRSEMIGPKSDTGGWRYTKIHNQEDWDMFVGYFVLHCGLSFGGKLEQRYAKEIAAWSRANKGDQTFIEGRAETIFGEY